MKNYKKINLKQFSVVEIENVELHTVFGGDWIASIGAAFANTWCATKAAYGAMGAGVSSWNECSQGGVR